MLEKRCRHATVVLHNEIFVTGGFVTRGSIVNSVEK